MARAMSESHRSRGGFPKQRFMEGLIKRAREMEVGRRRPAKYRESRRLRGWNVKPYITFQYFIWINEGQGGIELNIHTPDKGRNKAIYDSLKARKTDIEVEVGASLDWNRLDDDRSCRIRMAAREWGLWDEDRWPAVQEAMIEAMDRFSQVLSRQIQEIVGPNG